MKTRCLALLALLLGACSDLPPPLVILDAAPPMEDVYVAPVDAGHDVGVDAGVDADGACPLMVPEGGPGVSYAHFACDGGYYDPSDCLACIRGFGCCPFSLPGFDQQGH